VCECLFICFYIRTRVCECVCLVQHPLAPVPGYVRKILLKVSINPIYIFSSAAAQKELREYVLATPPPKMDEEEEDRGGEAGTKGK